MSRYRLPILLLVLGLLVACDDQSAPPKDPVPLLPSAPKVQAEQFASPPAVAAPKPVAPSAAPASADAKPDTVVAPVDVAEASAKQTPTVLPALGSKAVKDTSLPKPEERAPKPAAKVSASKPLPAAKLDLRLPPGMVEQLQPEEPVDIDFSKPALLPEMFVEKPTQPGPFELNGRLITNDHSKEDYWDSVEGAELQFKFRN